MAIFSYLGVVGIALLVVAIIFNAGKKFAFIRDAVVYLTGKDPWSMTIFVKFFKWPWMVIFGFLCFPLPTRVEVYEVIFYAAVIYIIYCWQKRKYSSSPSPEEESEDEAKAE